MSLSTKAELPDELLHYLEQFSALDELNQAADALSAIARLWLGNVNISGPMGHEYCKSILESHREFHRTLCICHTTREYSTLWNFDTFQSLAEYIPPYFVAVRNLLKRVEADMQLVVTGSINAFPEWLPGERARATPPYIEKLLKANIPKGFERSPLMLLHGLGSFQHTPSLRRRLDNIFRAEEKSHVFLVNNSGAGKTRLLYEGLCLHWGIFFTFAVDYTNLGSEELRAGFAEFHSKGHSPLALQWEDNVRVARRISMSHLLANLFVFRQFAQLMNENHVCHDHKKRWLLLKLASQKYLKHTEPFFDLLCDLRPVPDDELRYEIKKTLREVRNLCGLGDSEPFFLVLDECNVGINRFPESFRDEGGNYPILKEFLRCWMEVTADSNVAIICAGTEIPRSFFRYTPAEWKSWSWTSDTGCFDDASEHASYIARYMPDADLATPSGERLLQRMTRWLRGRHRATAAPIQVALTDCFSSPHSRLDDFICNFTGYLPQDGREFTLKEPRLSTIASQYFQPQKFASFKADPVLVFTAHEILLHYLVTGHHPPSYGLDRIGLVSEALGRLDGTTADVVVMDEPLSVAATATWFTTSPRSIWDFKYLEKSKKPVPQRPHCLAPYMAIYLLHALASGIPLSELFLFPGVPPHFAHQTAEVVVPWSQEDKFTVSSIDVANIWTSSHPLVTRAMSDEDTERWLRRELGTAFCIPSSDFVDLLLIVRLADGSLLWIMVGGQIALNESDISTTESLQILSDLHPEKLSSIAAGGSKRLPTLENACPTAGKHSLLRIVATFPSVAPLDDISEEYTHSPFASLNTAIMDKVMSTLDPKDAVEGIVFSVLGERTGSTPLPTVEDKPKPSSKPKSATRSVPSPTERRVYNLRTQSPHVSTTPVRSLRSRGKQHVAPKQPTSSTHKRQESVSKTKTAPARSGRKRSRTDSSPQTQPQTEPAEERPALKRRKEC